MSSVHTFQVKESNTNFKMKRFLIENVFYLVLQSFYDFLSGFHERKGNNYRSELSNVIIWKITNIIELL